MKWHVSIEVECLEVIPWKLSLQQQHLWQWTGYPILFGFVTYEGTNKISNLFTTFPSILFATL